jgi:hypothetical protein
VGVKLRIVVWKVAKKKVIALPLHDNPRYLVKEVISCKKDVCLANRDY